MPASAVFLLWIALLASFGAGCSREPSPGAPTVSKTSDQGWSAESGEGEEVLPRVAKVPTYAGSEECKSCHEKQHVSWFQSYHRTMTQLPIPGAVQADFNNVTLTNLETRYILNRKGDEYWIRMENLSAASATPSEEDAAEIPLGLVTGSHHMQVFWVPVGHGNAQMGFPFTWLIPEKRWVPRNTTFLRPPGMEHRPETWNHVCARCHATATQPNYDRTTKTWRTEVADFGIACEACHGPGEKHAAQQRELQRLSLKPDARGTNLLIIHPEKLNAHRSSQICGYCHSMKWLDRKEGWPEHPFTFRPGQDLDQSTPVIRPKEIDRQPWLHSVLEKNPDLLNDFFWPDGMIRVSGREYNGLIESPCYKGGQFSCLSCHSMHQSEPNDQLAHDRQSNQACIQCHDQFRIESVLAAHTRHLAGSTGSACYNCHMPHTTYGVLSAIRSHQVSSPTVKDHLATGRPNACNLCHLDKTLAWTSQHLTDWHGHAKPELREEHSAISESVRLGLGGDAGQRALIAWHFGWEPAVQTAGKSWIPAVLARQLDDPYAAVRCVAERSLRSLGDLIPGGYDYTAEPSGRPRVSRTLAQAWASKLQTTKTDPVPASTGVDPMNLEGMHERFERLESQRDPRPVRLRE